MDKPRGKSWNPQRGVDPRHLGQPQRQHRQFAQERSPPPRLLLHGGGGGVGWRGAGGDVGGGRGGGGGGGGQGEVLMGN